MSCDATPPWCLSGLCVSRRWRRCKVATRLCEQARALALHLGLPALSLYTRDQQAFFGSLGWQTMGPVSVRSNAEHRVVTRMRMTLRTSDASAGC